MGLKLNKLFLITIFLFVMFSLVSFASANSVSIIPSSTNVNVGNTFSVSVSATTSTSDLYSLQFDLNYNPAVLRLDSLSPGTFLLTNSTIVFNYSSFGSGFADDVYSARNKTFAAPDPGVTGTGSVAVLSFTAIGAGNSGLNLSNVAWVNSSILNDSVSTINPAIANGSVVVNTPPQCILTDANWSGSSTTEGQTVLLNVAGTNCDGQFINFSIWDYDTFGGDDSVTSNPVSVQFISGIATQTWTAEWQSESFPESDPPEYYFIATMVGDASNSITSSGGWLYVNQIVSQNEIVILPTTQSVNQGQSFIVEVRGRVQPGNDLNAVQMDIIYDSTKLLVNNVTEGTMLNEGGSVITFFGRILSSGLIDDLFVARNVSSGVTTNEGTIAVINFTAIGGGTSYVNISNALWTNSTATNITIGQPPYIASNGSVVVSGGDTTAPIISNGLPQSILPVGTTSTPISVTTNEAATCRWSTIDQVYSSMPNIFAGGGTTSHTSTRSSLSDGGSYTTYVRCSDIAGNVNPTSYSFTFSVASGGSNNPPAVNSVVLSSTSPSNLDSDNLSVAIVSSDPDGNSVSNITDWRINTQSIAVLNMPFDTNVSSLVVGAVKDYSTYGNNGQLGGGTQANAPTWTYSSTNRGGYTFDGGSDYINVPNSASLDISGAVSVELWMTPGSVAGDQVVFAKLWGVDSYVNPFYQYGLELDTPANLFACFFGRVAGTMERVYSTTPVVAGNLYHVVCLNNGVTIQIYVNGVLEASSSVGGGITARGQPLIIGRGPTGTPQWFNGNIYDLKVYNRALSAGQIRQDYLSGIAGNKIINNQETTLGQNWTVAVTPSDSIVDGTTVLSNQITIGVAGSQVCNNGIVEGTEQCDGLNLNGQTCISQGYTGGILSCVALSCTFNTTACTIAGGPGELIIFSDAYGSPTAFSPAGDFTITAGNTYAGANKLQAPAAGVWNNLEILSINIPLSNVTDWTKANLTFALRTAAPVNYIEVGLLNESGVYFFNESLRTTSTNYEIKSIPLTSLRRFGVTPPYYATSKIAFGGSSIIAFRIGASWPAGVSNLVYVDEIKIVQPATAPSCTDADVDGYNTTTGGACGTVADCDDNNPLVNPGALENIATDTCGDGLDNDCDVNYDWDTQIWSGGFPTGVSKSSIGDNDCLVDVYSVVSGAGNSPKENLQIQVYCDTSVDMGATSAIGVSSVNMYIENATSSILCTPDTVFYAWLGSTGSFYCPTDTPGAKTLRCQVNTSRSFSTTSVATLNLNVLPNCIDGDGDGYNQSKVGCGVADCNDVNPSVNPGATESCNLVDDDCDTQVDEGVTTTFYQDVDNDNYGKTSVTTQACAEPLGYASVGNDCNDANPSINPGATEICNGVDDNCDAKIDLDINDNSVCSANSYYCDADTDTFISSTPSGSCGTFGCIPGGCTSTQGNDCNDGNPLVNSGATEICDEVDNNCVGGIDEGVTITFYRDNDGDTYGNNGVTTQACIIPGGYSNNNLDCDDNVAAINPNAAEICGDTIDQDCSGADLICPSASCAITSLGWSAGSASEGNAVVLSVSGTNCNGLQAEFLILEYDGLAGEFIGGADDLINVTPSTATFNNGVAASIWNAEWQDDGLMGMGGDPEYYFRVLINGTVNETGKSLGQLLSVSLTQPKYEVINIPLQAGKNAFSLPLIPENLSIISVFNTTLQSKADRIYTYDNNFEIYYFDKVRPSTFGFIDLEIGRGYVLSMNQPAVLAINGTKRLSDLTRPTISLSPGWHLIGTFSNLYTAQTILGQQNVNYSAIYTYNPSTEQFESIASSSILDGEKGYWIYIEEPSTFVPLTGFILQND